MAGKKKEKTEKKRIQKGDYGHLDSYRKKHLIWCAVWFLVILTDVVFSLLVFQTRKTLFTIMACVMSIPFAQNLVALWLSLGLKSLSKREMEEVRSIAEKKGIQVLYDVTVTDEGGVAFYPALTLENDRIIALSTRKKNPEEKKMGERMKAELGEDIRYQEKRKLSDFQRELSKMPAAKDKQKKRDLKNRTKLLEMGF